MIVYQGNYKHDGPVSDYDWYDFKEEVHSLVGKADDDAEDDEDMERLTGVDFEASTEGQVDGKPMMTMTDDEIDTILREGAGVA